MQITINLPTRTTILYAKQMPAPSWGHFWIRTEDEILQIYVFFSHTSTGNRRQSQRNGTNRRNYWIFHVSFFDFPLQLRHTFRWGARENQGCPHGDKKLRWWCWWEERPSIPYSLGIRESQTGNVGRHASWRIALILVTGKSCTSFFITQSLWTGLLVFKLGNRLFIGPSLNREETHF